MTLNLKIRRDIHTLHSRLKLEDVKSHVTIAGYNTSLRLYVHEGVDNLLTSNRQIPYFRPLLHLRSQSQEQKWNPTWSKWAVAKAVKAMPRAK